MFKRKDLDFQDIILVVLMLAYFLYVYYSKQLMIAHYQNDNVVFGLNCLKFTLSVILTVVLAYSYKDLLLIHWRKFAARSWIKYLWIVLGWVGVILVLNFTRSICKWIFDTPTIHNWNPLSLTNENGFDFMVNGWSMVFILLNQLIMPFSRELVFRHILFLKFMPQMRKMIIFGSIAAILFGLGFYHVDQSLVGCLPYMFCSIVFMLLYYHTRNIWYPIFTQLLVVLIMVPMSLTNSFLLPYCS